MEKQRLDDETLESFIQQFYGYGSYQGDYWFIGMEERGGERIEDIRNRLAVWRERGGRALEDVEAFHRALGITSLFGQRPRLQPTWSRLIRIVLAAEGESATTGEVRRYQGQRLGREDGDTCLLELLPLPAPSVGHWHYRDWSALPYLASRKSYRQEIAPRRASAFRQRVQEYQPRAVLFYSTDARYRYWWRAIAGGEMEGVEIEGIPVYRRRHPATLFLNIPHPVAHGLSNRYFEGVGRLIAAERPGGGSG